MHACRCLVKFSARMWRQQKTLSISLVHIFVCLRWVRPEVRVNACCDEAVSIPACIASRCNCDSSKSFSVIKCSLPSGPKNINFGPDGKEPFQLQQTGIDTNWVVSYNIHQWRLSQLMVQAIKRAKTLTIVRAVVSVSHTYLFIWYANITFPTIVVHQ